MKMFKVKRFFVLIALTMAFAQVGETNNQSVSETAGFQALRIAHAGGGLGKRTYTNSIDDFGVTEIYTDFLKP